ncbi:hypothetical protein B0H19DRAFT_1105736 [Mycena capillaripes]|nr:hypothetical protein B0H19DRAFT_1105736 [Mycena capillaripes]
MDGPPPTKRQRTDDVDAPETPLLRSTEYWFDDGNIILQVESTQFRLTKSMLAMHSSVFRDMFAVPLPPDEPTVENCPIVVLPGDTSQDWVQLLGVMYPKSFLEEVPGVELIAAILRLGKKYDIPHFRKDCLRRLKMQLQTTLEEYTYSDIEWIHIKEEPRMLIPLITVAREVGLLSILPILYYCMVAVYREEYMPKVLDDKDTTLGTIDRLACLQGYIKLLELQSRTTMGWLDVEKAYIPAKSCSRKHECGVAVKDIIHGMSKAQPPAIYALNEWNPSWEIGLCTICQRKAKKIFRDNRKKCWDTLPSVFGLPAWEELKSSDFE